MKFLKDLFSVSNNINENVVVGFILLVAVLVSTFIPLVDEGKYYILSGMTMLCFGIGAFKK